MADYASEFDVYEQSGYTSEMVQRITDKNGTDLRDETIIEIKDLLCHSGESRPYIRSVQS